MEFPPYPCTGDEEVFDDVELLDADGNVVNRIVASACFAEYYCTVFGGTWRRKPPEDSNPGAVMYPGASEVDAPTEPAA